MNQHNMGLDMFMTRKNYVGNKWRKPGQKVIIRMPKNTEDVSFHLPAKIKTDRVQYIEEEIAYWRKANAVHQFFVDNCNDGNDNCRPYRIEAKHLRDLYNRCHEILTKCELKEGRIKNGSSFEKDKDGKLVQKINWVEGKYIKNPGIARKLLPTTDGFFFGSTDYNEWYYEDIKYTKEMLDELFKEDPQLQGDYYYEASW